MKGKVKWFDTEKGYGFIIGEEKDCDIFVHFRDIVGEGHRDLDKGDEVEFELVESEEGLAAGKVKILKKARQKPTDIKRLVPLNMVVVTVQRVINEWGGLEDLRDELVEAVRDL